MTPNDSLLSLLQSWHLWLIVGICCAIGEMLTYGFVLLCFSFGAFAAAAAAFFGLAFTMQMSAFVVIVVVLLASFRRIYLDMISKGESTPTNMQALIGKEAIVLEDIDNVGGKGRAKVDGEDWSARSSGGEKIPGATVVVIKRLDGNKLIVEKKDCKGEKC
ncbi:MAG: NfeD family protein [Candidatus Wallbacteria bacterium]|nr:NfeD family protein [Candidatus Wallbacteria bacterium]